MSTAKPVEDLALLDWRREFPTLNHSTYLINNSLGAMPRSVEQALGNYTRMWMERGVRAWQEEWWMKAETVGNLLGEILGGPRGSVSIHQNVTIAQAVVWSCLTPTPKRNKIVYSGLNFPSVRYFYQSQSDVEIEVVPCPDDVSASGEALAEAIDERTLLVPISHVIYSSSSLTDVAPVIEKAHAVGALVVLDVYQSAGAIPLDLARMGVDFAVGGSVKWLCAGPGAGYLYVRPDLAETLTPRLTGWMAHQDPFAFEPEMSHCQGAYRFLNGTPNVPALYAAQPGYEIIREVGVERIRDRSRQLTQRIIELCLEAGFQVGTPVEADRRGGAVTVDVPQAHRVSQELLTRDIVVDFRPGAGIRIAPHFFNTRQEVEFAVSEMKRIVDETL